MPGRPFSKIRSAAIDGRAQNPFFRRTKLKALHEALAAHAADIQNALRSDSGHTPAETKVEFWLALGLIASTYNAISTDEVLDDEYRIARSVNAPNAREPVSIVLIEPAAHTFLYSLISALAPALGAGNCVIVQAERSMLTAPTLVLKIVGEALGEDIFEVAHTPVAMSDVAYRHRRVMQNGCTGPLLFFYSVSDPQTKVVAIVERDADIEVAARTLVAARTGLGGKSPYAPDLVLVNEWVKKAFLEAASRQLASLAEISAKDKPSRGAQSGLVKEALSEATAHVVSSSSFGAVIDVKDRKSALLQNKVQEATLLVHSVTSMDDAIDTTSRYGRLAAAYVFAAPSTAKYIAQFIETNSCFINHLPPALLYGPVAPKDQPLNPASLGRYEDRHFTLPKAQFIDDLANKHSRIIEEALFQTSAKALAALDAEATATLKETVRPKKGGDIGFFNQGIVTGGVIVLSTVLSGTGFLCYYLFRVAQASLQ
ncbi:Aldehyde/histidinol dehydrogenase [Plectosphaerella plurivora]|uniref:Aldehyde/histidinol dehydrogenase n=1 Tax=Plectosphaerella plurivora TaxID=936078 RepID=A0A9P9AF41_9PEZI|nr:Aldehyde/histidinol dehydrogenase [Plectosphaerella plurivora]